MAAAERTALRRSLAVTGVVFLAEVVGGVLANSIALLADAAHMLTDLLALALSAAAIQFAGLPPTRKRTFGYYRLEILSALANGILLAAMGGGIVVEAVRRFRSPSEVRVEILWPVALVGLAANLVVVWWLSRAKGGLSTRAALWHATSDGAGSVLVLLAAGVMAATSWWWVDPTVSLFLAGFVIFGSYRLLRESIHVLLESTPYGMDLERVQDALLALEGVEGVHDLHVWSLTSEVHALSGHVQVSAERLGETDRILGEARDLLEEKFGITHTTIQVESTDFGPGVCVLVGTEEEAGPSPETQVEPGDRAAGEAQIPPSAFRDARPSPGQQIANAHPPATGPRHQDPRPRG